VTTQGTTMTELARRTTTADDVMAAARALGPTIAARAAETEGARRVPPDLLAELIDAGCFRIALPVSHGGVGADLPTALDLFETVAAGDGSTGWTLMIGAVAWVDLAGLSRAAFDDLFAGRGDVIVAGAFDPTGASIVATGDGRYRVDGRWGFASGCEHATWLYGNCIEGVVDGVPRLRIAVFSPEQIEIEDTWNVSGLRGTGSHHLRADDVVVAAERTLVPLAGEPCVDAPIARIHTPALIALVVSSVAIGIAQGALDEVVALAAGKVPLLAHAPLAGDPLFQHDLAVADTDVRAARSLVHDTAEWLGQSARDGVEISLVDRARVRAAAVWATDRAVAAVDAAYRAGGGSSLYADSPLQRRLRDIHALTQHFIVRPDTLTTAGAILAGQDVTVMVF
jgi:alkylation response protein AidB-like acyl-CoA dehydrogenase